MLPFAGRVRYIIALAEYVYEHTKDSDDDEELDDLCQLVVEYMVIKLKDIKSSEEFESLLWQGGAFVLDFWRLVDDERLLVKAQKLDNTLVQLAGDALEVRILA